MAPWQRDLKLSLSHYSAKALWRWQQFQRADNSVLPLIVRETEAIWVVQGLAAEPPDPRTASPHPSLCSCACSNNNCGDSLARNGLKPTPLQTTIQREVLQVIPKEVNCSLSEVVGGPAAMLWGALHSSSSSLWFVSMQYKMACWGESSHGDQEKGTRLEDTSICLPLTADVNVERFLNISRPQFHHLESAGVGEINAFQSSAIQTSSSRFCHIRVPFISLFTYFPLT